MQRKLDFVLEYLRREFHSKVKFAGKIDFAVWSFPACSKALIPGGLTRYYVVYGLLIVWFS